MYTKKLVAFLCGSRENIDTKIKNAILFTNGEKILRCRSTKWCTELLCSKFLNADKNNTI